MLSLDSKAEIFKNQAHPAVSGNEDNQKPKNVVNMLNYIIYISMGILFVALMVSFTRVRNMVKNGNPDLVRAGLFLQYNRSRRTILFVIDGLILVFFVQAANMFLGLQHLTNFYYEVMIGASLICLILIGYTFIHLSRMVMKHSYNPAHSDLERRTCSDDWS